MRGWIRRPFEAFEIGKEPSLPSKTGVHENYCTYYKLNHRKFDDTNTRYNSFAYWLPHEDRDMPNFPVSFSTMIRYDCILSCITQQ